MAANFKIYDDDPRVSANPRISPQGPAPIAGSNGDHMIYDEDPRALYMPTGGASSATTDPNTDIGNAESFAGLSPEQRGELAVKILGPPKLAEPHEVVLNALVGAGYAAGDIPAALEQIAARYLLPQESKDPSDLVTGGQHAPTTLSGRLRGTLESQVEEYDAEKAAALAKPGGTVGYVGGQIGTAFLPGSGPLKLAAGASKIAKVAAAARPAAVGAGLTALRPYESEQERSDATAISAGLGATLPAAQAIMGATVRGAGRLIRPRSAPVPPVAPGATPGVPPVGGGPPAPPIMGPPAPPPAPPPGGFNPSDAFIRRLKSAPESRKKGELLQAAKDLAVKPTAGDIAGGTPKYLESQMLKLPGSRKIADAQVRASRESYHRALGREIGLVGPDEAPYLTIDVIQGAKKKLSDAYESILPKVKIKNGTAIAGKLAFDSEKLIEPFGPVAGATIKASAVEDLKAIRDGIKAGLATGEIKGKELKMMYTHVRELSEDRSLRHAVRQRFLKFRESLKDTFASSLDPVDPELAKLLRETDIKWANASILAKVQKSAGTDVEGYVSGPKLHNAILARYGDPGKAGNFGKLAEMGKIFFQKLPDSGTADRVMANTILSGGLAGGVAGGLIDPSTAIGLWALPKLSSHAYYQTPAYLRAIRLSRAAGSAGARIAGSGAGRTGQPTGNP